MASDDLSLEEFPDSTALAVADDAGEKTAADLATVFEVPAPSFSCGEHFDW